MIFHLSGTLDKKTDTYLIIDCAGVGYQVFVPETLLSEMPAPPEEVKLYIYHQIREDAQTLYGFPNPEDRELFTILTSVSGVGPKVGIKILGAIAPQNCIAAILKEDVASLTSVSGVGKKMAERLIIELKDKLQNLATGIDLSGKQVVYATPKPKVQDELFSAMKSLGYSDSEIKKSYLRAAMELTEDMSVENSIKVLLKNLV